MRLTIPCSIRPRIFENCSPASPSWGATLWWKYCFTPPWGLTYANLRIVGYPRPRWRLCFLGECVNYWLLTSASDCYCLHGHSVPGRPLRVGRKSVTCPIRYVLMVGLFLFILVYVFEFLFLALGLLELLPFLFSACLLVVCRSVCPSVCLWDSKGRNLYMCVLVSFSLFWFYKWRLHTLCVSERKSAVKRSVICLRYDFPEDVILRTGAKFNGHSNWLLAVYYPPNTFPKRLTPGLGSILRQSTVHSCKNISSSFMAGAMEL